ncbi:hypothetical protein R6H00_10665, partial [Actinotignum timonense]|nr:hypothetical protein [Actinotignum timonense]
MDPVSHAEPSARIPASRAPEGRGLEGHVAEGRVLENEEPALPLGTAPMYASAPSPEDAAIATTFLLYT